ncbi:MAG: hypothetical protein H0T82_12430 [Sphingomonas sp.]|nr:hypothetical protein [Sphingomonas sp.]
MSGVNATHNPALAGWVDGSQAGSDFPIQNLPLGIFATPGEPQRPGIAIGH